MAEEKIATVAGKTMVKGTYAGPASYAAGGVYQRVSKLKDVDVAFGLSMSGGYVAQVVPDGYTGDAFKYKVFYQTGVSGDPLAEAADGIALTGETIEVTVIGD